MSNCNAAALLTSFPNESSKSRTCVSYLFHRKKFEIATDEVGNFIKQDEKKGVLREVSVICIKLLSLLIASL